jgi:DNA-binding PadR family transcriptional regulator
MKTPINLNAEELAELLPLPTAAFFVLFALADGEKHGYRIMQEIKELSGGQVNLGPATLYTNIQRFVAQALIVEIESEASERRRTYRLSLAGSKLLQAELRRQEEVLKIAKLRKLYPSGGKP